MNRRMPVFIGGAITFLWAFFAVPLVVFAGVPFAYAALLGAGVLAGGGVFGGLLIAGMAWAMRGERR